MDWYINKDAGIAMDEYVQKERKGKERVTRLNAVEEGIFFMCSVA